MTVVYIDVVVLLNAIVDYLLLLASARITGEQFSRLRLAGAAALGGIYAAVIFLPGGVWLSHPCCKICAAGLMVIVGYGKSRRLFRLLLVFIASSATMAGMVLGLQLLGTGGLTLENGVLYTGFNIRIVLVTAIICYGLLRAILGRAARHGGRRRDLCHARIEISGNTIDVTALIDTGNTLLDPTNQRPVMIADAQLMNSLLPENVDLRDPVGALGYLDGWEMKRRCRLLPYRAVGVDCGLLLAIRTDRVVFDEKEMKGILVALSPTPVSDGGAYQALIGEID